MKLRIIKYLKYLTSISSFFVFISLFFIPSIIALVFLINGILFFSTLLTVFSKNTNEDKIYLKYYVGLGLLIILNLVIFIIFFFLIQSGVFSLITFTEFHWVLSLIFGISLSSFLFYHLYLQSKLDKLREYSHSKVNVKIRFLVASLMFILYVIYTIIYHILERNYFDESHYYFIHISPVIVYLIMTSFYGSLDAYKGNFGIFGKFPINCLP